MALHALQHKGGLRRGPKETKGVQREEGGKRKLWGTMKDKGGLAMTLEGS